MFKSKGLSIIEKKKKKFGYLKNHLKFYSIIVVKYGKVNKEKY